ncbi:unnamed protein product, partial [Trichogramma brassicae]
KTFMPRFNVFPRSWQTRNTFEIWFKNKKTIDKERKETEVNTSIMVESVFQVVAYASILFCFLFMIMASSQVYTRSCCCSCARKSIIKPERKSPPPPLLQHRYCGFALSFLNRGQSLMYTHIRAVLSARPTQRWATSSCLAIRKQGSSSLFINKLARKFNLRNSCPNCTRRVNVHRTYTNIHEHVNSALSNPSGKQLKFVHVQAIKPLYTPPIGLGIAAAARSFVRGRGGGEREGKVGSASSIIPQSSAAAAVALMAEHQQQQQQQRIYYVRNGFRNQRNSFCLVVRRMSKTARRNEGLIELFINQLFARAYARELRRTYWIFPPSRALALHPNTYIPAATCKRKRMRERAVGSLFLGLMCALSFCNCDNSNRKIVPRLLRRRSLQSSFSATPLYKIRHMKINSFERQTNNSRRRYSDEPAVRVVSRRPFEGSNVWRAAMGFEICELSISEISESSIPNCAPISFSSAATVAADAAGPRSVKIKSVRKFLARANGRSFYRRCLYFERSRVHQQQQQQRQRSGRVPDIAERAEEEYSLGAFQNSQSMTVGGSAAFTSTSSSSSSRVSKLRDFGVRAQCTRARASKLTLHDDRAPMHFSYLRRCKLSARGGEQEQEQEQRATQRVPRYFHYHPRKSRAKSIIYPTHQETRESSRRASSTAHDYDDYRPAESIVHGAQETNLFESERKATATASRATTNPSSTSCARPTQKRMFILIMMYYAAPRSRAQQLKNKKLPTQREISCHCTAATAAAAAAAYQLLVERKLTAREFALFWTRSTTSAPAHIYTYTHTYTDPRQHSN